MTATVICGVDHSPGARSVVEAAATVAQGLRARLVLAHARDGVPVPLGRVAPPEALLADLLEHIGDVLTEVVAFEGDPARGLCRLAERTHAPLLVVGAQARGLLRSLGAGSVSASVLRRARCPVMLVPDAAPRDVGRPIVDGATVVCGVATPADLGVARMAARLASALEVRLRLAHILAPLSSVVVPGMYGLIPAGAPPAGVVPDSREATALLRSIAEEIWAIHPELEERTDWRVRGGRPAEALVRLGIASRATLVVVGTAGHAGLGAAISRSPACALARAATVPVLVCRDDAT